MPVQTFLQSMRFCPSKVFFQNLPDRSFLHRDEARWRLYRRKSFYRLYPIRGRQTPAIRKCLGEDVLPSRAEKRSILAGELVVWNDNLQDIMPFYKLRRHIPRAGRWIGCRGDPAPNPAEHLMIVFHDLLCWDDRVNMYHSYEHRREHLRRLVSPVPGRAAIGFGILLDFGRTHCVSRLAREIAYALSQRWEGLVLKACQGPYINSAGSMTQLVKLKKDYIPGLGDSVDLLVIGGRTGAAVVQSLKLLPGSWTTFFLACRKSSPSSHDGGDNRIIEFRITTELRGRSLPSHLFSQPAVVEVVGAGFDRPPNAQYLTLRFPRILKTHHDWNAAGVVDFAGYQHLAKSSLEDGNKNAQYASWLGRLDIDYAES